MEMEERNLTSPSFQMVNVKKTSNDLFFFCRSSQSCKVTPLNDDDDEVLKNWSEKFLTLELK